MSGRKKDKNLISGFSEAGIITKKFAKTFYFASRFLPRKKKYAAYSVYAICRMSDEAVDNNTGSPKLSGLKKLRENIDAAYDGAALTNNLLLAFQNTVQIYGIPKRYFDELVEGMQMDLNKARYKNFHELSVYCYRVAGVVGLIMLKILGCKDPDAEKHAISLGVAMQLTNILRDIKEDCERGRIYLPQDELNEFGVLENDISGGIISENFRALMKFQIKRARNYYSDSQAGIKMIDNPSSRFVALSMKEIYAGILESIEKDDYDVFSKHAFVNNFRKISIALRILSRGSHL